MGKRKFPREAFKAEVEITHNDSTVQGEAENISLSGLLVKTSESIEVNSTVDVVIYLGTRGKQLKIEIKGVINRSDERGIAIKFINDMELNKKLSKAFL